jgi:transposase-like protein
MVHNGKLPENPEPVRKRRVRSKWQRRQVVEETMRPGAPSVAVIARAHGVNVNQVFNWRKLYQAGRLIDRVHAGELPPARISESSNPEHPGAGRVVMPHWWRARSRPNRGAPASGSRAWSTWDAPHHSGATGPMISPPSNTNIWIAAGITDMRRVSR